MGFLSRLFGTPERQQTSAPSEGFPTTTDAIAHLIELDASTPNAWLTLVGESAGGTEVVIQVAEDSVNFLTTEVDLPGFLDGLGLTVLADATRAAGSRRPDMTLWKIESATKEELVTVIDALFVQHFALGPSYRLTGWLDN